MTVKPLLDSRSGPACVSAANDLAAVPRAWANLRLMWSLTCLTHMKIQRSDTSFSPGADRKRAEEGRKPLVLGTQRGKVT